MTVVNKVLIPSKQMLAAVTLQYTAPTTARTAIDKFTATNTSVSVATITIYLAAAGDTLDNSKKVVDAHSIQPNETYEASELVGHMLEAGGFISTEGTASSLTIRASGREIT
jgi:hypothetical protein